MKMTNDQRDALLSMALRKERRARVGSLGIFLTGMAFTLWSGLAVSGEPSRVVCNFSAALPSSGEIRTVVDRGEKKVGLGAARLEYHIPKARGKAGLWLEPEEYSIAGPGRLTLWVKGDKSGNRLQTILRSAQRVTDAQGNTRFEGGRDDVRALVTLDFDDWREISLDIRDLPKDQVLSWRGIFIEEPGQKEPQLSGVIHLDDLRVTALAVAPTADLAAGMTGSRMRIGERELSVYIDARNFTAKPVRTRARLSLLDRNESVMADRDQEIELKPGESREIEISLSPDSLTAFSPPFHLTGDVLSPDLTELSGRVDEVVIFGNGYILFEPFLDVGGHWYTRGGWEKSRTIADYTVSETPRFSPEVQTSVRIKRVPVEAGADGLVPPGRFAMRAEFTGDGGIFNGREPARRYLPGDAFRIGFWIKGDGSGAQVRAVLHDYSDMTDYYEGGWKRVKVEEVLCTLDFTGWRYIERDLPGLGVGEHGPKGSTPEIDYPLELAGFFINAASGTKDEKGESKTVAGVVEFGPVFVHTQQRPTETFAVFAGYDDPVHAYRPDQGAWAAVQNGWPWGEKTLNLTWSLSDRENRQIGTGRTVVTVAARAIETTRFDLTSTAEAAASAVGPFRLQVTATDAAEASSTADHEIMLIKPDSRVILTGFEEDRSYPALRAYGRPAPAAGTPSAKTTTETPHTGERALAIAWSKVQNPDVFTSIDPPLPGVPVRLSLWVYGDGSGVTFYPLLGDRYGVNKGVNNGQWDLFTLRSVEEASRAAITVDWTGWREITFHLPPVPPCWNVEGGSISFVPRYPLGLHLAVRAGDSPVDSGVLRIDDITVDTHLPQNERVGFALEYPNETNIQAPVGSVAVRVWNRDLSGPRTLRLEGGALTWLGTKAPGAVETTALTLAPGEERRVVLAAGIPTGAYAVRVNLYEGSELRGTESADLLVADLNPFLGPEWRHALEKDWLLRAPLESRFRLIDEDWDWVEHYPGNVQTDTARQRMRDARAQEADPYLLLGYSAYWASGPGYEACKANSFIRRARDIGHGVDVFLVPENMSDWNDYAGELMRNAGAETQGWVLWDNPDGSGPLGMTPEKFSAFVTSADRWRKVYTPEKPILIGGMRRETSVAYLEELGKTEAAGLFDGIHMRLDLGRLSPEDAYLGRYVRELKTVLKVTPDHPKSILFTDLDWAVEAGSAGLDAFDQAAYLSRAALLLDRFGLRMSLSIANVDFDRVGLGLAYRRVLKAPPHGTRPATLQLKPAWWGLANILARLRVLKPIADVMIQDLCPDRSFAILYRRDDGVPVVAVWRNDDPGVLSFASTGLTVTAAEDIFGSSVSPSGAEYPVGKAPIFFSLQKSNENEEIALQCLQVRDLETSSSWPQQPIAAWRPAIAATKNYQAVNAAEAVFSGRTSDGEDLERTGIRLSPGGTESLTLQVPQGAGLVLQKEYFLDDSGFLCQVSVDGASAGEWNLAHAEKALSGGLRRAIYLLPASRLAGKTSVSVTLTYPQGGNSTGWIAFAYTGGVFPLTALGAIHAEQTVAAPRPGRNIIGGQFKISETAFRDGIGCFAPSLLEYPLNRQFSRFRAQVGIDAITEGKGSVVFEIYGDGEKLWSSPAMSGLTSAQQVDLSVEGVDRLRLVVSDTGGGQRYGAGNWCNPELDGK